MPLLPLQNLPTGNSSNNDVAAAATAATTTTNTTHTTSSSKSNLNNNINNDDIENILTMSHDDVSPPLVVLTEYKGKFLFWFHFVKYPLIFLVVNVMIIQFVLFILALTNHLTTLTVIDNKNEMNFSAMRQYVGVWSILSLVDVYLIYHYGIRVLETQTVSRQQQQQPSETDTTVRVNHLIYDNDDDNTTIGTHAQVSRKIDEILRRDVQRPGGSFLAAITWLVLIGVGTIGCTCSAWFIFLGSPLFQRVCTETASMNQTTTTTHQSDDDPISEYYNNTIDHIPEELQQWAKDTHPIDENFMNIFVLLAGGLTYSAVYDALDRRAKLASRRTTAIDGQQLIQMHSNVNSPYLITGFTTGDDHSYEDLHLNDGVPVYDSFCCLYLSFAEPSAHGRTNAAWFDYSILCVPPLAHNHINPFGNDIFPNVTLHRVMVSDVPNELYDGLGWDRLLRYEDAISGASIVISSKNEVWVQVSHSHDVGPSNNRRSMTTLEFYKIYLVDHTVLEKELVTNVTFFGDSYENQHTIDNDSHHHYEPTPMCEDLFIRIYFISVVLWFVTASAYLTYTKRLSIGILPMYSIMIIIMWSSRYYSSFSMVIFTLSFISFLGLLGVISVSLDREQLCLVLYMTLLLNLFGVFKETTYHSSERQTHYLAEDHILTLAVGAIIGFVLDHPVLYLSGWIFSMYSLVGGLLSLFLFDSRKGLVMLGLGAVIGCGSVTIGSHIITYRSYIIYNSKRLWFLLNNSIQQRMTMYQHAIAVARQQRKAV